MLDTKIKTAIKSKKNLIANALPRDRLRLDLVDWNPLSPSVLSLLPIVHLTLPSLKTSRSDQPVQFNYQKKTVMITLFSGNLKYGVKAFSPSLKARSRLLLLQCNTTHQSKSGDLRCAPPLAGVSIFAGGIVAVRPDAIPNANKDPPQV